MSKTNKKILYIDMDNVLVDFRSAFPFLDDTIKEKYKENMDDIEGIFSLMKPMKNAIESFKILAKHFDVYILSTSPWDNPTAASEKVAWVKKYLPELGYKRLILSHNKNLNFGSYIIDDRLSNGVDRFSGEHIHFGQENFKDWNSVVKYLLIKEGINEPELEK